MAETIKVNFFPLDFDYIDTQDGKGIIRVFGRMQDGKKICVIDFCKAYFYAIPSKNANLEKLIDKIKKVRVGHSRRECFVTHATEEHKNFLGKQINAIKIHVNNPKDISYIKEVVKEFYDVESLQETDINFVTRYLCEKKVNPLFLHQTEGQELNEKEKQEFNLKYFNGYSIKSEKISISDEQEEFSPRVLAFDIETSDFEIGRGEILMLALAGENFEKVLTWKKFSDTSKEIEFVKNETELIKRFVEIVKNYEPDILVGYFSDGFDMQYIRERAALHKIKLNLGVDGSNVEFIKGRGLGTAKISGIVHIDLLKFVSLLAPYLHTETLGLHDVSLELLGEGKEDIQEIWKNFSGFDNFDGKMLKKFASYNLQDAILTKKLFLKLWPNLAEMCKLVGEPLFNSSRYAFSQLVENYIIHNISRFNEIIPNKPNDSEIELRRRQGKYLGAFVLQPKYALYNNVVVFDFAGLYPSIIVSFNMSASTLVPEPKNKSEFYETPEFELSGKKSKFYFSKKHGFIPKLLAELLEKRKQVKQQLKKNKNPILEARYNGLKTLANATYGYYAFFAARWYCREAAASTAAFGRYYINEIINKIQEQGHEIIYGDTDSIMFSLGNKTENDVKKMLENLNTQLPGIMELELENFYARGLFVAKKTVKESLEGAKKKYALLAKNGEMKIRGFETVRRDWCALAKEVQKNILRNILTEGKFENSLVYVKNIISDLKNKKVEKNKLIIKTQLKKSLESYESIGPHVAIARRMQELGMPVKAGILIEYIIAKKLNGKKTKTIRELAELPQEVQEGDYDVEYYIGHQILPAVESIFSIFGITEDQILQKEQKKLESFFE